MSKRAGTFVTLRDVVDEVGRDPVRFMMLYRKELEPLDFDFAKVTEQSKDNPVFYRAVRARARRLGVPQRAGGIPRLGARQRKGPQQGPVEAHGRGGNRADQEAGVFPALNTRSGAGGGAAPSGVLSL